MTNEELLRRYYDGDEAALEKLYHKNLGLIRSIAKEAAADFNCLTVDEHHPSQFSAYTKTALDDLCGEGALEFLARIQSKEYDESRAALSTYLYPHIKGRMTRWLEQNIGCMALSKDEMAAVRQAQRSYHAEGKSTDAISEEMDISKARASRYVRYNTHFPGVHDLGKAYGVFGYPEVVLKEIGMYHMMKESAAEKAKVRAVEKLKAAYPGSRLQIWKVVHRMMQRPIPLPENNVGLQG